MRALGGLLCDGVSWDPTPGSYPIHGRGFVRERMDLIVTIAGALILGIFGMIFLIALMGILGDLFRRLREWL